MEDFQTQQPEPQPELEPEAHQSSGGGPPQSPFRRWLPTIVGITVVVLAVGGFSAWQFFQTPEDAGIAVPQTVDETANWETYRNDEFGFEFKYPVDTFDISSRFSSEVSLVSRYFLTHNPSGIPGREVTRSFSINFELRSTDVVNNIDSILPFSNMFPDGTIESFKPTDEFINRFRLAERSGFRWNGPETTYIFLPKNTEETLMIRFINFDNRILQRNSTGTEVSLEKQNEIFNSVMETLKFLENSQTVDATANKILSPSGGEQWKIGETNIIKIDQPVKDSSPFTHLTLINAAGEEVGIISCKIGGTELNLFTWNTRVVLNYCGAGLSGKTKEIEPGVYRIAITEDSEERPIVTISEPFSVISTDETANWETYRNEEYGFLVKYPQDWRIVSEFDSKKVSYPTTVLSRTAFGAESSGGPGYDGEWFIFIYDQSNKTSEDLIKDVGDQFGVQRQEKREDIKIGDLSAVKVIVFIGSDSSSSSWYYEAVIIEQNGKIYWIHNGAIRNELFDEFYKSFKLTD